LPNTSASGIAHGEVRYRTIAVGRFDAFANARFSAITRRLGQTRAENGQRSSVTIKTFATTVAWHVRSLANSYRLKICVRCGGNLVSRNSPVHTAVIAVMVNHRINYSRVIDNLCDLVRRYAMMKRMRITEMI
jgi:hypothetical protein